MVMNKQNSGDSHCFGPVSTFFMCIHVNVSATNEDWLKPIQIVLSG